MPFYFGLAAFAVSLAFAVFTGHAWEDYFITFRSSLNLATGNGLVFQPGERVHSFTSPLGTLIPALFAIGGGTDAEDVALRALWGLRIVSALALGISVWTAQRAFQRDGLAPVIAVGIGVAWVLDAKIVDFSMNGMETGLVVLFAVLTWHGFVSGARTWPCALSCAGLQWTRPDGFVYCVVIAVAWMLFGAPVAGLTWRARLAVVFRAGVAAGAIYLPWLVFTWSYYGSPVPHTIIAKAQPHSLAETAQIFALYPWRLLFGETALHDLFRPSYFFFGGWPASLGWMSRLLAVGAALAWLWPRVAPAGRVASAAFFFGGFYVSYIPPFPWYYPGWQAIGLLAWAHLLHAVSSTRPRFEWSALLPQSATRVALALLVFMQAGLFACVAWQMRVQQRWIETGNRREIGRWLAEQARPRDTVFLECLGYIGYYSGLKMLDTPGLASPEVVATRRAGNTSFARIIDALRPDWLVLRPHEAAFAYDEVPRLRQVYQYVRPFDVRGAIEAEPFLPGRGYVMNDAIFFVFRRAPGAEKQP